MGGSGLRRPRNPPSFQESFSTVIRNIQALSCQIQFRSGLGILEGKRHIDLLLLDYDTLPAGVYNLLIYHLAVLVISQCESALVVNIKCNLYLVLFVIKVFSIFCTHLI